MTMTPLTTIKIGTPIPFGDCQETVNLAHIINMTGYLVQLLEQPNLNFNLTQHQFKLYVSTLWFGQPHQPQLNNTGLLGPILIKYTQPKQQFQYNSNTNTIPIKITNIFKWNLENWMFRYWERLENRFKIKTNLLITQFCSFSWEKYIYL